MFGTTDSDYPLPAQAVSRDEYQPSSFDPRHLLQPNSTFGDIDYPTNKHVQHFDDISDLTLLEGLYLLLLSGASVSLGYLAADLSWPANFVPLLGLGLLLYLIISHRSALSPSASFRTRLAAPSTDEESFLPNYAGAVMDKLPDDHPRLTAILAGKKQSAVAGVYAFGKSTESGGEAQVWVIVEDMDV